MRVAICYRGHYMRTGRKNSNFFLCHNNHTNMILKYFKNCDIYFHTHSHDSQNDQKLVDTLKPKEYIFKKTDYISDSFIESNNLIKNIDEYDLILNFRFDLMFNRQFNQFKVETDKFNFLWEERKHYRIQLGYRKVTDLMFVYHPKYIDSFNKSCIDSRFSGGLRGTGHHLYPFMCKLVGEKNLSFMIENEHYDSNTDNKYNPWVEINRGR